MPDDRSDTAATVCASIVKDLCTPHSKPERSRVWDMNEDLVQ